MKPAPRLAVDAMLAAGATLTLSGNPAHYLSHVLRLSIGAPVVVFNRTQGEWAAHVASLSKREVTLAITAQTRASATHTGLIACFAPIKGGRLETIIEKATELGAVALQPVITARTIVDKVNGERADAIAREAAEQCERTDWPEIRPALKFSQFLSQWPETIPLLYGDESGESAAITDVISAPPPVQWGVLSGPEGGFTPEEFAQLKRLPHARGVGLGPRILRADTALITLCALTLSAWGDWHQRPRFAASVGA